MQRTSILTLAALAATALFLTGCNKKGGDKAASTIKNVGSDTMSQLAMAWSEAYAKKNPAVSVEVNGGGSGVGIAGLIDGSVDLANASRAFEEKEIADLKAKKNLEPKEFMVGYDALSIYVHKDSPLNEISVEQLAEIYKADGKIRKWSDLGVTVPGAKGDEIVVISRQNNSGTQHYWKEAVIGKKNSQRADTLNLNGSSDVVQSVGSNPNAIGYSGMAFKTPAVKVLKVSKKTGDPAVAPSIESTLDKSYPISRPMFVYTAGEPKADVKTYIDWLLSDAGQAILKEQGYVPLPKK
jgi:phosphate transport system substrate-binding protein